MLFRAIITRGVRDIAKLIATTRARICAINKAGARARAGNHVRRTREDKRAVVPIALSATVVTSRRVAAGGGGEGEGREKIAKSETGREIAG